MRGEVGRNQEEQQKGNHNQDTLHEKKKQLQSKTAKKEFVKQIEESNNIVDTQQIIHLSAFSFPKVIKMKCAPDSLIQLRIQENIDDGFIVNWGEKLMVIMRFQLCSSCFHSNKMTQIFQNCITIVTESLQVAGFSLYLCSLSFQ